MKQESVVIIGAGLGGLFTGAILAKEGYSVTLLEQNATIGGGLQTFERFGEVFDTGMHVIGGMRQGGNIRKICNYLGILDKVKLMDVDATCTDRLYFAEDQTFYTISQGREGFVDSLVQQFPEEKTNLERYVDAVFSLTEQIDLFNLRPSEDYLNLFAHSEAFLTSADDFIAQFVDSPKLRSVLAYMNPLYGGKAHQTPAYIHAIISKLYITGASRFIDGSSHFADLLANVITSHGGAIYPGDGVKWIEVNSERKIEYVRTIKGKQYKADYYISDIHPCTLLRLMDAKAFPKSYRERLDSIPNTFSAFSLYIKLKEDSFPYLNYSEYYMTRYDDIWNFDNTDKPWPLGFLFMTPPVSPQGAYSRKALVTAPMPFDIVRRFDVDGTRKRGEGYSQWKQEMADRLLALIEEIHPGFQQCIEAVNTASPLTIRDYFGAKEGTICGFSKDCRNMTLSQVPVVTKIKNLLLTGQNNNLHGFCGVPLTAINTSEVLLGKNYVINRINACNEHSSSIS